MHLIHNEQVKLRARTYHTVATGLFAFFVGLILAGVAWVAAQPPGTQWLKTIPVLTLAAAVVPALVALWSACYWHKRASEELKQLREEEASRPGAPAAQVTVIIGRPTFAAEFAQVTCGGLVFALALGALRRR